MAPRTSFQFYTETNNPHKIPKARLIENFWSMLADKVYDGGWKAKSESQLKRRICQKIKKINFNIVQHMMETIKTKLRKVEDKRPFSILRLYNLSTKVMLNLCKQTFIINPF